MPRRFLLGIDGLPCWLWRQLADSNVMPFSRQLLDDGILAPMQSSIPEVSSAAWASIVTGINPGGHNVYGFTDLLDGTYTMGFTSSRTFKASPFWNDDAGPSLVINVPQTYPAQPLNGVLVSGYVALDLDRAVHPADRLSEVQNIDYQIDADMSLVAESREKFLDQLDTVLDTRCKLLDQMWDAEDWQSVMFVITGTDRLNHYFWTDFEDRGPFRQRFLDFYNKVDRHIERIVRRLNDDCRLVVVSDHGFARQEASINLNRILEQNGFLRMTPSDRPSYATMDPSTRAFAMDPGRIYVHTRDRYPNGSVDTYDVGAVRQDLIRLFSDLRIGPYDVADRVLAREDVFSGPFAHRAPDLVVMPAENVALSARLNSESIFEDTLINGKHTFENSTFFLRSEQLAFLPTPMRVEDVRGILFAESEVIRRAA